MRPRSPFVAPVYARIILNVVEAPMIMKTMTQISREPFKAALSTFQLKHL